jgi:lysophospholipase L1-like esterase
MQHHFVIRARLLFASVLLASLIAVFLNFPRQKPCTNCVVLIGDSITSMWPNLPETQFSGLQIINRGFPGDTTSHMLSRFDHDVVRLRPRVVVILGGINEIAQIPLPAIEQNLASMAEAAEHYGTHVVLATLPPTGEYHPDQSSAAQISGHDEPIGGHDKIQTLNNWLKNFTNQKHYTIADYHSALSDARGYYQKGLTSDGIHPSLQGYDRMEPILREAIQSALHNDK